MAELTKSKGVIILECDCGAVHKITLDENKNLKVKSTYQKKDKEDDKIEKPKQTGEDDDSGGFFG